MSNYTLTGILWNASTSHDENDIIDIEMQCDMLLIVSCLCEGDLHRKVTICFLFILTMNMHLENIVDINNVKVSGDKLT